MSGSAEQVRIRLARVRERLEAACGQAGRPTGEVRLLAVSKRKPLDDIRVAYAAGQRDFGENYVQELVEKAEACADLVDLRWHLIGHLQRNKARIAVPVVSAVHTVDSERLVVELSRRMAERGVPEGKRLIVEEPGLPVFVEVNVGAETAKSGCSEQELPAVLDAVDAQTSLKLAGLMTLPPHTDDPAGARPYFDQLASLRERHGGIQRLPGLSMGMSHDLEHAVAAGATWVRIGTAIFGERRPKAAP